MAKIVCVLYEDPVSGYPKKYARDSIPKLNVYPDGQTLPSPQKIDFTPGDLLGCVSGELGLRAYLEGLGHELVVLFQLKRAMLQVQEKFLSAILQISPYVMNI